MCFTAKVIPALVSPGRLCKDQFLGRSFRDSSISGFASAIFRILSNQVVASRGAQ